MVRNAQSSKRRWLDPNREGRGGRRSNRYCVRCGTTIQHARILKGLNLCEFCVRELEKTRDGRWSCLGCGKVAPDQLRRYGGYCKDCVCPACGRPDPEAVRKYGMCRECMAKVGEFCRRCGKEAGAQVRKNRGLCDACAKQA